jgi:glyoxalase family protein
MLGTRGSVVGLHHVGLVSRDIARTADFYERVLGLRDLGAGVGAHVPFGARGDVRELEARYFGDADGRVGSLLSLVERGDVPQGAPGIGGTHHFALAVADREVLLMWKRRLLDVGYPVNGILDRHYFKSIYTKDPDGTIVELATIGPGWTIDESAERLGEEHRVPPPEMVNTNRDRARIAAENWPEPVPHITEGMRIRGMHHVTAIGVSIERTQEFVATRLGMRRVKRTNNFDDIASYHWYWGTGAGQPGTLVTYFERRPERERPVQMGVGQVSHYAVASAPDALEPLGEALREAGEPVSRVVELGPERSPFRALATADPDGQPVLLATADGATSYAAPDATAR